MKKAAIIGGGVIGGAWAARFLLNGWDVDLYDPDPEAERKNAPVFENARRSLPALYDVALPPEGNLRFTTSLEDAVSGAEYIQESVPERIEIKLGVYKDIQRFAAKEAILASSTSGFKPSELQEGAVRPEQIMVCHPFNPVYLLPLVELVPSPATDPALVSKAQTILDSLGMKPLVVRKEIDAHIADRFLEAVWREGLWLVNDGIATTQEIDDAIIYGFGLRWAQMGLFETYRCAGGEAGMAHFIAQFGPALKWPWTKLMDVPDLTDELVDTIASQSNAQSNAHSIQELWRIRDDNLVGMMRALKKNDWAAGAVLGQHEQRLARSSEATIVGGKLIQAAHRQVPQSWTDYNGHMNDSHYGEVFSKASDVALDLVGAGAAYVASGKSYFSVESHIRYLDECKAGESISVELQCLEGRGKKLRLFGFMYGDDGRLCATGEMMLIHVDLTTRAACEPEAQVLAKVEALAKAHQSLAIPEGAGKAIGVR